MSIDASIHLFFPISHAAAALQATRKVLRRRKYVLGIQVVALDGTMTRIPATALMNQVDVQLMSGELRTVEVPTISPTFPEVVGPEPLFPLEELASISMLDVEIAFRKDGKVIDTIPVGLSLGRGHGFFMISFESTNSWVIDRFFQPRFRASIAKVLADGGGVAATYVGMGEWTSFADHSPIEDPDGRLVDDDVDGCVAFLMERLST